MGYKKRQQERRRRKGHPSRPSSTARERQSSLPSQVSVRPLVINEETRWKPHRLMSHGGLEESDETRDARELLLLLNKVTPHNFDTLVEGYVSKTTIHQSKGRMQDAINEIITRGSLDMRYTQMYANLCQRLTTDLSSKPSTADEARVDFRETLLNYCRDNVSRTIMTGSWCVDTPDQYDEDFLFEHPDERRVRLALARQRTVGSKRFIGELFNNATIDLSDMLTFIEILLNQTISPQVEQENGMYEVSLECLCVLLDSCGKTLDEAAMEAPEMKRCWKALEELAVCQESATPLSIRMKCMVLDLLELRESEWNPKRYSCRQRKEHLVAKPLERDSEASLRRNAPNSRRQGKRNGKSVRFATK